jgi:hypothetical protein
MTQDRHIHDLKPGEAAYTLAHAAWIVGADMWLNSEYPIRRCPQGTFSLRLIKLPNGRLLVDLSQCETRRFDRFCPFGEHVQRTKVDEELLPPPADPTHRIYDMRPGETAYVKPSDVWVFNNQHMWLNGYTAAMKEPTTTERVGVICVARGIYDVDLRYCHDVPSYPSEAAGDRVFPIMVKKRRD